MEGNWLENIHPLDLLQVVRKRLWIAALLFITVVTSTTYWTYSQIPIYSAQSKIQIGLDLSQLLLSNQALAAASIYYESLTFSTQQHVIKSPEIAEGVVQSLHLVDKERDPEMYERVIDMVRASVSIQQIPDTSLFLVSATSSDPVQARDIANTVTEVYIQKTLEKKVESSRRSISWLTEQLVDVKDRIRSSEEELFRYQEEQGLILAENDLDIEAQRNAELNRAFLESKAETMELKLQLNERRKLAESTTDFQALLTNMEDASSIQGIYDQLVLTELELTKARRRYKEKHPVMIQLNEEITFLRDRIRTKVEQSLRAREIQYQTAQNREDQFRDALLESDKILFAHNKKQIDYGILKREAESQKEIYNALIRKLKEMDLLGGGQESNVTVVEYAKTPAHPVRPNKRKNILLGILGGLTIGLGMTFFVEYMDRTLKSVREIQVQLDLPLLAIIPRAKRFTDEDQKWESYFLIDEHPKSSEAEAFRALRTNLKFAALENHSKSVVITSCGPKEGKTTVVTNLGISLGEAGVRTLIVDTDLRKPQMHSIFDVGKNPGLTDCLLGDSSLDSVIYPTGKNNLWVVPCGTVPPNPSELLDSELARKTMQELTERFDFVLCDSPPIGGITDAAVLASYMGGVILLLQAGRVDKFYAKRVKEQLEKVKARIFGVVVNMIELGKAGYYYDYYYYTPYYYKYYDYYTDRTDRKPPKRTPPWWNRLRRRQEKEEGEKAEVKRNLDA